MYIYIQPKDFLYENTEMFTRKVQFFYPKDILDYNDTLFDENKMKKFECRYEKLKGNKMFI